MAREQEQRSDRSQKREQVTYTDYNIFRGNVRLVGEGSSPIVMDRDKAIELAKARGMNLVQIAYSKTDNPRSVCRIMDYSKFRYEQKKREKEARRRQREASTELKEIKFSIRIDDGDLNTKVEKVKELLEEGDKVMLTIRLLRRELSRVDLAKASMDRILSCLDGECSLETKPSLNGNNFSCIVRRRK